MQNIKLQKLYFKDDGCIPNSVYPLLLYRGVFTTYSDEGAAWLAKKIYRQWLNKYLAPGHIPLSSLSQ